MYYANHTPNKDAGPSKDAPIYPNVEGNLIPNGNFGDYHIYGKTYAISFYVKWLGKEGSINMTLKDDDAIIAWEAAGKPAENKRKQGLYARCNGIFGLFMCAYGIACDSAVFESRHTRPRCKSADRRTRILG